MALAKIREVRRRVEEVNELLETAGGTNLKRPLSKRCEKALTEPASDDGTVQLQSRLQLAMQELNALLDHDFRPTATILPHAAES